jgi:hypothetical protein
MGYVAHLPTRATTPTYWFLETDVKCGAVWVAYQPMLVGDMPHNIGSSNNNNNNKLALPTKLKQKAKP